jgi:hypothetical protein
VLRLTFIFFLTSCFRLSLAQWQIYDCSVLPTEADTAWYESNATNLDDVTEMLSVIDDADITGNKLIKVDGSQANLKEMWCYNWNADNEVGATLVFRAKSLDASTYDRDFDLYFKNGKYEERLIATGGVRIELDKSGQEVDFNTTDWHIYRITQQIDQTLVYIDEDPVSLMVGESEQETDANYFRFGDGSESSTMGSLYDWIIWDVSGAYAPGTGNPLPEELTGLPSAIEDINIIRPGDFELTQNYPNPFNPVTEIKYTLNETSRIILTIYDINGRIVNNLVDDIKTPGIYKIQWDGCDHNGNLLPSGVYFYSMVAGNYKVSKKMILLR